MVMSNHLLELENVSIVYPNGLKAIEDVSVSLSAGSICGLVGMNGAGKSTLFKAIMGFLKPTNGNVKIAGMPIHHALKQNLVAYVPQSEDVDWDFPILVKDVVMMGRYGHMNFMRRAKKADHEAVENALKRVGLLEYASRQIGELSGGQKKRVFVARALAQNGQIILLDEPFTGVDIKTEDGLISLFRELASEGRLILVSTHNLGSVPHFCDDVMMINKRLLAYGAVEEVFTKNNLEKAFGNMLRHHQLHSGDLHDDDDDRSVSVLTDDERPLVLYGEKDLQKIARTKARDGGE